MSAASSAGSTSSRADGYALAKPQLYSCAVTERLTRGHWLDRIVLSLAPRTLFRDGWGDLDLIERTYAHARNELLLENPGAAGIRWRSERAEDGCLVRTGHFTSPFRAARLPPGVENVPVLYVAPRERADDPATPVVVHLAGTGDEGFSRRYRYLAVPLARRGVASVILEQPYYGARRAPGKRDPQPRTVSELIGMVRAAMDETRAILAEFRAKRCQRLAVTGISMGGQIAALVAGSTRFELAAVPCLAPCVAGPTYFGRVCAWPALLNGSSALHCASASDAHSTLFRYLSSSDVREFPAPVRSDAAVVVAAERDAYVSPQDAYALHTHWPGSEFRWVRGGHISSFMFQRRTFRLAIMDALLKLDARLCLRDGVIHS